MDKYDYVTATIEEEKDRLEKIIEYLTNNKSDELVEYQDRYNNILKYLNAKERYLNIYNSIKSDKDKLNNLNKIRAEYEVDNILLEDTLLSRFHEDTNYKYSNLIYENIKLENNDIKDILYLLFEKESNYSDLVIKRKRLREKLGKELFPKTYETLNSQDILIEKEDSILDEIFILENNLKIEEDKLKVIIESVMTPPILKILYEFWIIDSYDKDKVNKSKLFEDNRSLISIKNNIEEKSPEVVKENKEEKIVFPDINLPGVDEDNLIDIDNKKYLGNPNKNSR